jgi:DNA polymerase-3 subunit gamma/tau
VFVLATTEAQKVLPTVVDRCHRFDFGRPSAEQVATVLRRVSAAESIAIEDGATGLIARHATGSFRDALGTLEQLVTYAGDAPITPQDVLTVLGVADTEQLFAAVDAMIARDVGAALRAAAGLASSGRDPGQVLRDLEIHARELLTVQVLGEVPPELRVTVDRDQRLVEQSRRLADSDAVRLLELIAAALAASANGAQPLVQLELVLIKAAAPEMDPSTSALLARIERLERGAARPEPGVARPEPGVARPEPGVARPEPGAARPEPGVARPEPDGARPEDRPPLEEDPFASELPEVVSDAPIEPARSPAASTPTNGTTSEISDMQRMWPAVVELVRGGNAMLGVLLESARPQSVTERELVLAFPAEAAFYKRKAEQEDYRRTTTEAVRNVTGMSLALRYELSEAQSAADEQPAPEPTPMSDTELVQRFVDEFGAEEILEDDPEGRS